MRKILLYLLVLLFTSSVAFANPFYDPNYKTVTYDKENYNIKLRNKLEDEHRNKCFVQVSPTMSNYVCGENGYYEMVLEPYIKQKKNFN